MSEDIIVDTAAFVLSRGSNHRRGRRGKAYCAPPADIGEQDVDSQHADDEGKGKERIRFNAYEATEEEEAEPSTLHDICMAASAMENLCGTKSSAKRVAPANAFEAAMEVWMEYSQDEQMTRQRILGYIVEGLEKAARVASPESQRMQFNKVIETMLIAGKAGRIIDIQTIPELIQKAGATLKLKLSQ